MAFQAAPDSPTNSANQNGAQLIASQAVLPPVFSGNFQAAPVTSSVNQQKALGHPIG